MSLPETSPIVLEARLWIGTPYRHQVSVKGAGCDCLGLIRGIWRGVIGPEPEKIPAYSQDWSEPQGQELLWDMGLRHMQPGGTVPCPGQVLLFRMRSGSVAKHLGVLAEAGTRPTFIHAYSGHGVVESALTRTWAKRIATRFAFPGEVANDIDAIAEFSRGLAAQLP